ncbi:hypothetical protein [Halomonas caseinilytica]|uniref:hypothetical protein n=1 Tax=Halomonas caseinilytica TaxID=438744 RepID=UPI000848A2E9|nr:hypothetical protein [Halomonas caseinilytica]
MKTCTVVGDLMSDKASENYPTDNFCDECYETMMADGEDSGIVTSQDYDPSFGKVCASCGKTAREEADEG